jgi:hypothetical protein
VFRVCCSYFYNSVLIWCSVGLNVLEQHYYDDRNYNNVEYFASIKLNIKSLFNVSKLPQSLTYW